MVINKRGIEKESKIPGSTHRLTWVSKYGSATFNRIGRDFPFGGMNEAGLVVEAMMLSETEYPSSNDGRPGIGLFQWIQYQLDNFSRIEEVIASDAQIKIQAETGAHFLVCDERGECAAIEFLGGRMVYHAGDELPVRALSNSRYSQSLSFRAKDQLPGNDRRRSIARFLRAAEMMEKYDPQTGAPVDYAFRILNNVANPSDTQWRIVYDIKNRGVYFQTRENRNTRWFFLESFDLSNASPSKAIDVNGLFSGDITGRFVRSE